MESTLAIEFPPDESRGYIINIVAWVGAAVATVFVALRIYTRVRITRSSGWDDILIAIAALLNIVTVSLSSVSIHYGMGRHVQYLTPTQITNTLFYSAILQPIGIMAYCLPKLAVVVLIIRLVGPNKRGVYFLYFVITVLFITSALSFIYLFARCDPPSHFWNPLSPAKCSPPSVLQNITYVGGSWSAFTDLVLAVFPSTIFWNIKMKKSRKIGLSLVMGLGILAMITAIYKTTQLYQDEELDGTWALFSLLISTFIETDVVIVCACAPTLPRLVLALMGKDHQLSNPTLNTYKSNVHGTYRSFDNLKPHGDAPERQSDNIELIHRG